MSDELEVIEQNHELLKAVFEAEGIDGFEDDATGEKADAMTRTFLGTKSKTVDDEAEKHARMLEQHTKNLKTLANESGIPKSRFKSTDMGKFMLGGE